MGENRWISYVCWPLLKGFENYLGSKTKLPCIWNNVSNCDISREQCIREKKRLDDHPNFKIKMKNTNFFFYWPNRMLINCLFFTPTETRTWMYLSVLLSSLSQTLRILGILQNWDFISRLLPDGLSSEGSVWLRSGVSDESHDVFWTPHEVAKWVGSEDCLLAEYRQHREQG